MAIHLLRRLWCALLLVMLTHGVAIARSAQDRLELAGRLHASPRDAMLATPEDALQAYRQGRFEALPGNLGRGYRRDDVWLAFDLHAADWQYERAVLEVGPAFLDQVRAFLALDDGRIVPLGQAGDQVPPHSTPLPALKPAFVLDLRDVPHATVLLNLKTTSTQAAIVTLYRPAAFLRLAIMEGLFLGALFAVCAILVLLTIALYALERHPSYLLWLLFLLLTSGLWFLIDGLAYRLFAPAQLHYINTATNALGSLSLSMTLLVSTYVFGFRDLSLWLHRLFVFWPVLVITATTSGLLLDLLYVPNRLFLLSLPLVVLADLLILYRLVRGHRPALLYGWAHLAYTSLAMFNVVANLGLLTVSQFSLYGWQWAGSLYLIALQLAVLGHAREAQRLHAQERNALLDQLASKNQELEQRVCDRTAELAQALEQVRHSEEAQRQLLSMASHEFRTPAAMIKASLDSLGLLKEQVPQEIRTRLDNIRLASQRLVRLTGDLIQQDRLHDQRLQPQLRRLDLRDLVEAILRDYPHDGWLTAELPQAPVWIDADPALITILLNNLLDNAARYGMAASRGALVRLREVGDEAWLEVADRGAGLSDEDKLKVFERYVHFRPQQPSGVATSDGSGLGLFIVRSIAQTHGGEVEVADNRPHGCVFTVRLPCKRRS